MNDVTIIIPTIPIRRPMLQRALISVATQIRVPDVIIIETDPSHSGAAVTRNRALAKVKTEWVAFLDDDDELMPNHIDELMYWADDHIDVMYSGCDVVGPSNEIIERRDEWGRFGLTFDAALLRHHSWLPVTSLCRTKLAQQASFAPHAGTDYDDWGFYIRMLDLGARFVHHPIVTWIWHHHGSNTSGRGDRW